MFGKRDIAFLDKQGWDLLGTHPVVIRERWTKSMASGIAALYVLNHLREEAAQKKAEKRGINMYQAYYSCRPFSEEKTWIDGTQAASVEECKALAREKVQDWSNVFIGKREV